MTITRNIRVIPKLEIKGQNLIKGLNFEGNRVLGHSEYFAEQYYREGADELFFQDPVASLYQRDTLLDVIIRTAKKMFIPMTVAGGIRSVSDMRSLLRAGADKVGINTAALKNPSLISEGARVFGSQCIVCIIEAKRNSNGTYECWADFGRQPSGRDVFEWARQAVELGAGEIILSSVDRDGGGEGFDIDLISRVSSSVPVPVIAASGAGTEEDFVRVVKEGLADAVCAASIFHYRYAQVTDSLYMSYNEPSLRMGKHVDSGNIDFLKGGYGGISDICVKPTTISSVKQYMHDNGIPVRIESAIVPADIRAL
jgi:cyclase